LVINAGNKEKLHKEIFFGKKNSFDRVMASVHALSIENHGYDPRSYDSKDYMYKIDNCSISINNTILLKNELLRVGIIWLS